MKNKVLLSNIIFISAILLSIGLMLYNNSTFQKTLHPSSKNIIDAFMTKVQYKDFNKKGELHSRLFATQMLHYHKNNSTYLTNPNMQIYTAKRIPWRISAKFGKTDKGTKKVQLWRNVVIHRASQQAHSAVTITTSKMTLYPKQSRAYTKRYVTIKRAGATIHGEGLQTNFKTGISKIMAHARGVYDPKAVQ